MLSISQTRFRRILTAFFAAAALLIGIPAIFAQVDPGQQATAQAQQDMIAAMQAVQQASQQAMQAAQQAAASTSPTSWPHPGYGRADKPTFSPRPGTFSGPVHVTISDPTIPKAEIFYTLDGSPPTTASIRYTGPVLLTSTTKIRAIARSPIYSPSRAANGKYVIR